MAQITLHLLLQIGKGIEAQVVIEALLIVSVTSLNLAVMPRCSWPENMVENMIAFAKHIKRMYTLRLCRMCEFGPAVGLDLLWSIAEVSNGTLDEIDRRITRMLLISIDKSLSGCFFDDGVLVKLFLFFRRLAGGRHIFYV